MSYVSENLRESGKNRIVIIKILCIIKKRESEMIKKLLCLVLILTILSGASTAAFAAETISNQPGKGIIFDDNNLNNQGGGWINLPSSMMSVELRCIPGCTISSHHSTIRHGTFVIIYSVMSYN